MEFLDVVKNRTSTRKFSDKEIEDSIINNILEVGRLAPTAKNLQPQKIYVVKSKDGLENIDKVSPCRYNAPVCLLICSDKNIAWSNGDYSTYEMDASIVATHLILGATNYGIDSTWIRNFNVEDAIKCFELADGVVPICIINLGYKTDDCPNNPMHEVRKELDETVYYI